MSAFQEATRSDGFCFVVALAALLSFAAAWVVLSVGGWLL